MNLTFNLLVAVCLAYVAFLFVMAFAGERQAARGGGLLRGPGIYTLSLSIYCTAWTFYGAVGYAARSGLEFMTIYLGPTLVFVGWWWVLRKLVRIGRAERITSIADILSSRYGKSNLLAVIVTILAVIGTTPYISLQLQSVTLSFGVFATSGDAAGQTSLAFWVATGLAVFTILFGTRNLDANERHDGIVTAIAVESIVKLVALLSVGIFVVWGLNDGLSGAAATIAASPLADWTATPGRWAGLIFVSAAAIICLPRMFQVLVVENTDERHLATASWAFPLYLLAMCLFVVPIAATGLARMPAGANPDLYVLTLPLAEGRDGLAMLAFLGGFSSATSMVIVASVALATMLSNHIVMPLWLAWQGQGRASISGDVRRVVLGARRASILVVLAMGYAYYAVSGGTSALAAIGLISFVGMAQVLPALMFGLFWTGATRIGAASGIVTGFAIWAWTMLLPVLMGPGWLPEGPFGIGALRPEAMFGLGGDPFLTSLLLSIGLNVLVFCAVSLLTEPTQMERLQAPRFVQVFDRAARPRGHRSGSAGAEELLVMAQRILGAAEAQALFGAAARGEGRIGEMPHVTPALLETLERRLSGSVGAATAHAMVTGITGDSIVSVEDLLAVADETAQIMEYSAMLQSQSDELTHTAEQLREANAKLTALGRQKDAFLSQVSHELRTPMTSIRAFSEILRMDGLEEEERARYAGIIQDESQRLTRLLDDLLDLSVLESGQGTLNRTRASLADILDRAVTASGQTGLDVIRNPDQEDVEVETDTDRLAQVFINLITNAAKYCEAAAPSLRIRVGLQGESVMIDFIDNGAGIAPRDRGLIFEKFARLSDQASAGSAGLGLAICREVMMRLDGTIDYLPGQGGAAFRVRLPRPVDAARAAE
ncbi:sensor histidine kinase [Jannaschia pohangensis]|uniref:histidine kinase n=1 Tax=Jannaschia pohangensis TaxID=390807 RepID=A0A1I3JE46_9RHOB|nr:sensor histidine kinase [Jannaschia pohangensis]SFI58541.1 Na+/proline symporter [Jannaschia pohangensis]